MSNIFDKAYEIFNEQAFKFGLEDKPTIINPVGNDWAPFGAIEGDSAKMIYTIPKAFTMLYKSPPGVFKKTYHRVDEAGNILEGEIEIITAKGSYTVHEGQSFFIARNVWHKVIFKSNVTTIFLNFHPAFKSGDWEAVIV